MSKPNTEEYKENIKNIKRMLKGQGVRVLKELEKEMKEAAGKQDFERAAKLRNQWEGLQNVLVHKKIMGYGKEERGASDEGMVRGDAKSEEKGVEVRRVLQRVNRIEGYDISNIQGAWAVGSMVVFERFKKGGFEPKKSDYRRFKIKTIRGVNDPAMLKEVLMRRLCHPEWPLPQLVLVDGGKAQQNAALDVVTKRKDSITVFALAKREEELYTGKKVILASLLPKDIELLFLHIRNEAHRFAIGYYRKLHAKNVITKG